MIAGRVRRTGENWPSRSGAWILATWAAPSREPGHWLALDRQRRPDAAGRFSATHSYRRDHHVRLGENLPPLAAGGLPPSPAATRQLEERLDAVERDMATLQGELSEAQERLDFAERMLAQTREPKRLE